MAQKGLVSSPANTKLSLRATVERGIERKRGPGGDTYYLASVWSAKDDKRLRHQCGTLAEARLWRSETYAQLRTGKRRAPTKATLLEDAEEWLKGARRRSDPQPLGRAVQALDAPGYEEALRLRVLPRFGKRKTSEVRLPDLYRFAEDLRAEFDASTIRNTFMPLRAIYGRLTRLGEVAVNPTIGLDLPAAKGRRDRIAEPAEAAMLIAALPEGDRALWATAFYAGLRRGELKAIDWAHIDLAGGVIRVEHGWDRVEGEIDPKSEAGDREVPIAAVLRDHLIEHRIRYLAEHEEQGLVFGAIPRDRSKRRRSPTGRGERGAGRKCPTPCPGRGRRWSGSRPAKTRSNRSDCTKAGTPTPRSRSLRALTPRRSARTWATARSRSRSDRYAKLFKKAGAENAALLDAFLERSDPARVEQLEATG